MVAPVQVLSCSDYRRLNRRYSYLRCSGVVIGASFSRGLGAPPQDPSKGLDTQSAVSVGAVLRVMRGLAGFVFPTSFLPEIKAWLALLCWLGLFLLH